MPINMTVGVTKEPQHNAQAEALGFASSPQPDYAGSIQLTARPAGREGIPSQIIRAWPL
jgi:hypothetical protein